MKKFFFLIVITALLYCPLSFAQNIQTGNSNATSNVKTTVNSNGSVTTHIESTANGNTKVLNVTGPGTYEVNVSSEGNNGKNESSSSSYILPNTKVTGTNATSSGIKPVSEKSPKKTFLENIFTQISNFIKRVFSLL